MGRGSACGHQGCGWNGLNAFGCVCVCVPSHGPSNKNAPWISHISFLSAGTRRYVTVVQLQKCLGFGPLFSFFGF